MLVSLSAPVRFNATILLINHPVMETEPPTGAGSLFLVHVEQTAVVKHTSARSVVLILPFGDGNIMFQSNKTHLSM